MNNPTFKGHLVALFTCLFWGTTFICTKVLLVGFAPVEILLFRFCLGFFVLFLIHPHRFPKVGLRRELTFAAAGLTGVFLYYLLENVSLSFTTASNVGLIVSSAPFFTALLDHFFGEKQEKLGVNFFVGFVIAMGGIALINFNGSSFSLNPTGDLLALLAAIVWGVYSLIVRRISAYGYPTALSTRRIFQYGILFMIPAACLMGFHPDLSLLGKPVYLFNLLFLGIMASALCFVCWNYAVRQIGAVGTSLYIYLQPVVTVVASVLVLREPFTPYTAAGTVLTLAGLILSEYRPRKKNTARE